MYIVAIAWIYVVLMMSITEHSVVAGILTFIFYGVAPLALFLWLFGTPLRRRAAARRAALEEGDGSVGVAVDQVVDQHDAADAGRNEQYLVKGGGQFGPTVQAGDQVGDRDVDHARGSDAEQVGHRT